LILYTTIQNSIIITESDQCRHCIDYYTKFNVNHPIVSCGELKSGKLASNTMNIDGVIVSAVVEGIITASVAAAVALITHADDSRGSKAFIRICLFVHTIEPKWLKLQSLATGNG